jgi:3-hydroxyisobutyrate dehydrogenase-like beta-hydroxyacid dehydrogenase
MKQNKKSKGQPSRSGKVVLFTYIDPEDRDRLNAAVQKHGINQCDAVVSAVKRITRELDEREPMLG